MRKEEIKPNQIYRCTYNVSSSISSSIYYYLIYFDTNTVARGYLVGMKAHDNHPQNHKIAQYTHSTFISNTTLEEYNDFYNERYIDFVDQLKIIGITINTTTYSII